MDNSGKNKNDSNKDKRNQNFMTMAVIAMVMMFVFSFFTRSMTSMDSDDLSYNEFLQIVQETDTGKIVSVEIDPAYNKITLIMKENGQEVAYETGIVGDIDDLSTMLHSGRIRYLGNDSWYGSAFYHRIRYLLLYDEKGRRWNHGRRQKYGQDVHAEGDRCYIQGCGRTVRL